MNKLSTYFLFILLSSILVLAQPNCNEGEKKPCGATAIGECSYGTQICVTGQWGICLGEQGPIQEVCENGLDDDCDGLIDEGCECISGETRQCGITDEGICEYGQETCIEGTWDNICAGEIQAKLSEICDNDLDDDCDGEIDEECEVATNNNTPTITTCFNGVQDGEEEGIDCGGNCRSCVSCVDGILNQGETKVNIDLGGGNLSDCGGPNCPTCPSCFDGILNQGETGIDCGGNCRRCIKEGEEDTDQDGLTQTIELQRGTNPNNPDTDGDGINDKLDRLPLCPNNFCDLTYGETESNCPEDCQTEKSFPLGVVLVILLILFLIIGGYLYYQFKKGTKNIGFGVKKKEKQNKIIFDTGKYYQTPKEKQRKTATEKQLEKSLDKADKYFKK